MTNPTKTTRTTKTANDPVVHFAAAVAEIVETLYSLRSEADDHFGVDPDHVNWGHVGDANRILAALRETLAIARNENH